MGHFTGFAPPGLRLPVLYCYRDADKATVLMAYIRKNWSQRLTNASPTSQWWMPWSLDKSAQDYWEQRFQQIHVWCPHNTDISHFSNKHSGDCWNLIVCLNSTTITTDTSGTPMMLKVIPYCNTVLKHPYWVTRNVVQWSNDRLTAHNCKILIVRLDTFDDNHPK